MNRHIYVDVTEIKNWNGHLTGVQRLVFELAAKLKSVNNDVRFCSYDSDRDNIHIEETLQFAKADIHDLTSAPAMDTAKDKILSLYFRVPIDIRQKVSPNSKKKIKNFARRSIKLLSKTKKTREDNKSIEANELKLTADDCLLIPGRLWDYPDYMNLIIERKKEIGFKLATIIYDFVPLYQGHTFGPGLTERYAPYAFQSVFNSDILFPISESTRNDLKRFAEEMGLKLPNVQTIRLGDDNPSKVFSRPNLATNIDNGFGICVGTLEARKNHILIYYAYKLASTLGIDLAPTIIIGKPGWLTNDILYFIEHDNDVKHKIEIINDVTDEELSWLYRHALFSIYPSQYEGWGLPVAESLVCGTPVITSDTSSMKEISDLADLISPYDSKELMDKIKYYSNLKNSNKKREEITRKYKPYSWEELAKNINGYLTNFT